MESVGLLGSVALLIWLALRGVDVVFAALLCSFLVILSNGLPPAEGITDYYSFGPLGAFSFAGKFFLLFVAGAIFGRVMGDTHAATSIALALVRKLGTHRVLWITTLSCAMLTYGGVVVFVVIFAIYPLGLRLLQEADIPKRLFCAAAALGAGTFTLSALPGTPSIQNVISAASLGTDLFAGGWLGMVGAVIMFGGGMWYLERQRKLAISRGEHFVAGPQDGSLMSHAGEDQLPPWSLAILPLALVLLAIMLPRLVTQFAGDSAQDAADPILQLMVFAVDQPIVWPSLSLFLGTLLALVLFRNNRRDALLLLGDGSRDAIMPLINTAADARRAVDACYYPPKGQRSCGPMRDAMVEGLGYLGTANDEIACLLMIETAEGLANLDAIAAVPGVTGLFVGPMDLSYGLGLSPGDFTNERFTQALQAILKASAGNGLACGMFGYNADMAAESLEQGFDFVSVGSDISFLRDGLAKALAVVRGGEVSGKPPPGRY